MTDVSQSELGGLMPAVSPAQERERELARRVNAYVLRHVHSLEDLAPIGRYLVEIGGVEPLEAGELLKNALSEGRVFDSIGSYREGLAAIWRSVGRPVRQRTFEEILGPK
jgi:hypothetical protein